MLFEGLEHGAPSIVRSYMWTVDKKYRRFVPLAASTIAEEIGQMRYFARRGSAARIEVAFNRNV